MNKENLSPLEAELIEAIRNYRLSYPNGKEALYRYAQSLFEESMSFN